MFVLYFVFKTGLTRIRVQSDPFLSPQTFVYWCYLLRFSVYSDRGHFIQRKGGLKAVPRKAFGVHLGRIRYTTKHFILLCVRNKRYSFIKCDIVMFLVFSEYPSELLMDNLLIRISYIVTGGGSTEYQVCFVTSQWVLNLDLISYYQTVLIPSKTSGGLRVVSYLGTPCGWSKTYPPVSPLHVREE